MDKKVGLSFEQGKEIGIVAQSDTPHHIYSGRSDNGAETGFAWYADRAKRFSGKKSIEMLCELNGGHCVFCGEGLFELNASGLFESSGVPFEWDHILPASKLGLTVDGNICPICSKCNNAKRDTDALVFFNSRLNRGEDSYYISEGDFKDFLGEFSKPYREVYGDEIFTLALNNSRYGATDTDLRLQLSVLLLCKDTNGEDILGIGWKGSARATTPTTSYIEAFKEKLSPDLSPTTRAGYYRIIHKIQYAMDDLISEGQLQSPDMADCDAETFKILADRVFTTVGTLSTPRTRHGDAKRFLKMISKDCPQTEVRELGNRLSSYAIYRNTGMSLS